ncbi:MAG: alpha/beta fold hydrolase [Gemmatimonadota bacterium]
MSGGARQLLVALTLAATPLTAQQAPRLEHFTVTVDGHPFAVWARRPLHPKGVILLQHGSTWSSLPDFDLQVPGDNRSVMVSLATRGYATYALDLRGYGATPRDSLGWNTPDRATEDLAGVLAWVATKNPKLPKPYLVGWSNGARVGQLLAQRHPDFISRLVLYGAPAMPATQAAPTPFPTTASPHRANTAEAAASDFISPDITPKRVIDLYVKAALKADTIRAMWTAQYQWGALDPAKVTTPTLLIQGEHDPVAPFDASRNIFSKLATADKTWVILPGSDHAALLEDTHASFIAAIVSFLERPRVTQH